MKKIIYSLMAATFLFATSCSEDEVLSNNQGNEAEVTFTTNLDGILASRAIADGTTVDQLTFGVFDAQGKPIQALCQSNVAVSGKKATVKVNLVKGQTYSFTFWAQNSKAPYTLTDYKTVTVNYEKAASNDETRDAFFAVRENLTVKGSINETITLKRPFAQINVGTTPEDLIAAGTAGIKVDKSAFAIETKVANSLNLLTGEVSGETTATFTSAAIPAEDLKNVGGKTYEYLAMNYVLVDAEKSLVDAKFTLNNGETEIAELSVPNLPVQRNYRTNIVGNILTNQAVFDVVVDEEFEEDEDYVIEEQLEYAAANGGTVTLTKDVELTKSLNVTADMVLNLNGHDIINNTQSEEVGVGDGIIVTKGHLTINGEGLVKAYTRSVWARGDGGAVITINGGSYSEAKGNSELIYASGNGQIIINGGYFEASEKAADLGGDEYALLNCYDAHYKAGTANITVKGGKYKDFNPANNTSEGPNTNFVADGYKSVNVGTETEPVYEVCVDINVEEGGTVTLEEDGTIVEEVNVAGTLDGKGHTLTVAEAPTTNHLISGSNEATIKNLTIVGENQYSTMLDSKGNKCSTRALYFTNYENIIIDGVTVSGVGYAFNTGTTNVNATIKVSNSKLVGWSSYNPVKEATFTNVHFGIGTYFGENSMFNGGIRPYSTAVFDNCTFDKGFYLSFEELTGEEKIILKNCKVDGTELTNGNWDHLLQFEGNSADKISFE